MKKYIKADYTGFNRFDELYLSEVAYNFFDEGYRPEDIAEYMNGNPEYAYLAEDIGGLSNDELDYICDKIGEYVMLSHM